MNKNNLFKLLALLVIASLALTACGGSGDKPAEEGPKVTSTGFECPEPSPRMEVTSKELNIFVWTEYFPQDMLDCFELVYDIKLNRDE
jgi:spermidine/putrescine-binding protein